MTRCVTLFCAEGWSKSVDVTHAASIRLNINLSAHGEERWLPEEIFAVVNLALLKRDQLTASGCTSIASSGPSRTDIF